MKTTITEAEATRLINKPPEKIIPDKRILLNIVVNASNELFAYCNDISEFKKFPVKDSLGNYITEIKKNSGNSMVVLLKLSSGANYKASIDLLDLMTIHQIDTYAMVDPSKEDLEIFDKKQVGKSNK